MLHGSIFQVDETICPGDTEMNRFFSEFMVAARETPRMYFAPLVGAIKGVRHELRLIERSRLAKVRKEVRDK